MIADRLAVHQRLLRAYGVWCVCVPPDTDAVSAVSAEARELLPLDAARQERDGVEAR